MENLYFLIIQIYVSDFVFVANCSFPLEIANMKEFVASCHMAWTQVHHLWLSSDVLFELSGVAHLEKITLIHKIFILFTRTSSKWKSRTRTVLLGHFCRFISSNKFPLNKWASFPPRNDIWSKTSSMHLLRLFQEFKTFNLHVGAIIVALAASVIFLNSLHGDLIFDDIHAIIRNRFSFQVIAYVRITWNFSAGMFWANHQYHLFGSTTIGETC